MLADAEPVARRAARHAAGARRPGRGREPGQLILAALARPIENQAQGALEAVDNPGKHFGIYEIEVGIVLEITNSCPESFEIS